MNSPNPLMDLYLRDVLHMEAPYLFHRWALFTGVSSMLGRKVAVDYAGSDLHANIFCLLVGEPASKKSTAIGRVRQLASLAGYSYWGRDHIKRRDLIHDLKQGRHINDLNFKVPVRQSGHAHNALAALLPASLQPTQELAQTAEEIAREERALMDHLNAGDADLYGHMWICTDEMVDLIGKQNASVLHTLNNLYDSRPRYVDEMGVIENPYLTLMAAINPAGFSTIFNAETLTQGLLTRIILVHSEPSDRRCSAFAMSGAHAHDEQLIEQFRRIRKLKGEFVVVSAAQELFQIIHDRHPRLDDHRFGTFQQRREETLVKMCMCNSAMRGDSLQITPEDVLYCNTLLTLTEHGMPRALGAFAVDEYSKKLLSILQVLKDSEKGLTMEELIQVTSAGTMMHQEELHSILQKLIISKQITVLGVSEGGNRYTYKEPTLAKYQSVVGVTIFPEWFLEW